jgi:hypothetical protein
VASNGSGYVWYFENNTEEFKFDGKFRFDLTNMEITDDPESNEFRIMIDPGKSAVKTLTMIDPTQAWGYKYNYSFKCKEKIDDEEKLMQEVMRTGEKKQVIFKDEELKIFYYVSFINDEYVWVYHNEEDDKNFKSTFKFELDNLMIPPPEVAGERSDGKSWEIFLNPGEKALKRMKRVNGDVPSKYKSSYNYTALRVKKGGEEKEGETHEQEQEQE